MVVTFLLAQKQPDITALFDEYLQLLFSLVNHRSLLNLVFRTSGLTQFKSLKFKNYVQDSISFVPMVALYIAELILAELIFNNFCIIHNSIA